MGDRPNGLVLSVETAGDSVGVALARGTDVLSSARVTTRAASSEFVMAMVDDALVQTGTAVGELTQVTACRGPGSFTGIRVGLATARGLGLALGVPVTTITSFDLEAVTLLDHDGPAVVALDARRGQVYLQALHAAPAEAHRPGQPPSAVDPTPYEVREACGPLDGRIALIGSGIDQYPEIFDEVFPAAMRAAAGPARADRLALATAWGWGTQDLSPLYIRPPDAKLPRDAAP